MNIHKIIVSAQKCWEEYYTFARERCMNYPVGETKRTIDPYRRNNHATYGSYNTICG